jgi:hypothetical protein
MTDSDRESLQNPAASHIADGLELLVSSNSKAYWFPSLTRERLLPSLSSGARLVVTVSKIASSSCLSSLGRATDSTATSPSFELGSRPNSLRQLLPASSCFSDFLVSRPDGRIQEAEGAGRPPCERECLCRRSCFCPRQAERGQS